MSYREKIAWLSLIEMTAVFVPYFVIAGKLPLAPMPDFRRLGLFGLASVVRWIMVGVGYLYLRSKYPDEARMPPDERDRAITLRSFSSSYYVLMAGMVLVGIFMPFSSAGWAIVNAAIFWIVIAEAVHYGVIVVSYRVQS